MKKAELFKKMVQLEAANDEILAEIYETDQIMRRIGFSDGLETVKSVANEMFQNNQTFEDEKDFS